MNRSQRRRAARTERRSAHKVAALGSVAVLASASAGAALVLSSAPAGANAPIVVDSLTDDGTGTTLRDAIDQANTDSGQDQITFSVSGTITLTADLPAITEAVHVNGPGATGLTIDGADTFRVFELYHVAASEGTVEITGLTITHGNANGNFDAGSGGAIQLYTSDADMLVQDVALTDNYSRADGGAIQLFRASGDIVVDRVTFTDNYASEEGGGLYFYGSGSASLTVSNSTFSGNHSGNDGGGIFVRSDGAATVTVSDSTITDNLSDGDGGGICSFYGIRMTVERTTVDGNEATGSRKGGGIAVYGSDSFVLVNSTVSNNTAGYAGGGLYVNSYDNRIVQSTISGNTADKGGAMFVGRFAGLDVEMSTITGNTASGDVDGIWVWAGEAISSVSTAPGRRGGSSVRPSVVTNPTGTLSLIGSIVAGNGDLDVGSYSAPPAIEVLALASVVGAVEPINVVVTDEGGSQLDVAAADLHLGPLADNGGPTKTHALLPGSIALDAGPAAADLPVFDGSEYDQRGTPYVRVHNGVADVGAYEEQPEPTPPGPAPEPTPEPTFTG